MNMYDILAQQLYKIPLDPPLQKGEDEVLPFIKGR
jgi:hypothetical protein